MLQSEPLTPVPQNRPAPRPRKATPPPAPTPAPPAAVASPAIVPNTTPPGGVEAWGGGTAGQSPEEALRAEERFSRALVGAVEALATELEARIMGGAGQGAEMARLSRRVARQLGIGRRAADEIGVAAQLFAVDRLLRNLDGAASADLFADLGWAAAGESGLVPTLRALTAASAGFGRVTANQPSPTGARIIGAVADYLELGAATTAIPDLDTVSQLLRASPAGAQVVDALLRVLEIDRGDVTPTSPTVTPAGPGQGAKRGVVAATSVLKPAEDDALTPLPTVISPPPGREIAREPRDDDKTVRKPMPTQRKKEGE
jgi:hypothetical protein